METEKEKNTPTLGERLKKIVDSKWFRKTLMIILAAIIMAVIFNIGIFIGYRKASFSFRWGENYHKMFGGPKEGFLRQMPLPPPFNMNEDFIDAYGTTGSIIKIDGNNLIIKGRDNVEKTILISDKTVIRSGRQDIGTADLKVGNLTVTIGQPNEQGQISAKLIRVFLK